jgi:hypothetical protein
MEEVVVRILQHLLEHKGGSADGRKDDEHHNHVLQE